MNRSSRDNFKSNSENFQHIQEKLCYQLSPMFCPELCTMPGNSSFVKHHEQLLSMVRRTVNFAESNSVLIIGPRGSGKTALLKSVIRELQNDSTVTEDLLIVQLNGILHTDDRIALKDFARQLKLKSIFSKDEEVSGTFAEILAILLSSLREERQETKESCSIMVCLEEFDLFCSHKSQSLLYNLLNIAQMAKTPIILVGVTCRFDVIELLEKRVKSRFSHNQILLFQSKVLEDNLNSVRSILSIQKPDYGWNVSIEKLLKDKKVQTVFKTWFETTLNYSSLKQRLLRAVILLNGAFLTPSDVEQSFSVGRVDAKTQVLEGLSDLELALTVCILNYTTRTQEDEFNFCLVYTEFQKVATKKLRLQEISRNVVEKAYQRLEQVELIQSRDAHSGLQKEYKPMRLLVDAQQIKICVDLHPNLPTSLKQLIDSVVHGSA